MTDTQLLLNKIAALRQRLEQAQGLASEASNAANSIAGEPLLPDRLRTLQRLVRIGADHSELLGSSVEEFAQPAGQPSASKSLPVQLTARARRAVEQGRGLIRRLRSLGELVEEFDTTDASSGDPLLSLHREARAMVDTSLRLLQVFPDNALGQMRLCDGLEGIFRLVEQQLELLETTLKERREQQQEISLLADVLQHLESGQAPDVETLRGLARRILEKAEAGEPLRIHYRSPNRPAFYVACHCLNVAHVIARLQRHIPESQERRIETLLAALLHDAGMMRVPAEVLAQAGPLSDEQRRAVEAHCRHGAEMARKVLPSSDWVEVAVATHHERMDGTGYPDGLGEPRIDTTTRLLAVCDVYAAMRAPRPYRPACDPRTALTDTLLMAEQGALDKHHAELLLHLCLYPVGSIVELASGDIGRVVAAHSTANDPQAPARPVVALLTDSEGRRLPLPRFLDLSRTEGHSIVRALTVAEQFDLLGDRYLAWI